MKKILYALGVLLLAATAVFFMKSYWEEETIALIDQYIEQHHPSAGPIMLYKTNFSPDNTTLSAPTVFSMWAYQDITGINAKTGVSERILPWGAESSRLQMIVGAPVTKSTISNYIVNEIQQVVGPDGSLVNALFQTLKIMPLGSTAQDPLVITRGGIPTTDTGDVYYTYWIKLQPDLVSQLSVSSGGWRVLNALKSVQPGGGDNGDTRIGTNIYRDSSTNKLYWNVQQDENALGTGPLVIKWQIQNKIVPVPAGEWFKFEVFWHRSTGSDGRYWEAINGQVIADHWGPNMGSYNMPINRVMLNELYTGGKTPAYQWTTNLEIWNGFPCGVGVSCFNKSEPLDSIAPSSPTGLINPASSSTTVNLAWNKSADNVSVTGYKIYRDGIEIGTSVITNYIDTSVVAGTKYTYTVKAFDSSSNLSAASEAVTASPPLEVANLSITSYSFGNVTPNTVTINWTTNIPSTGVVYYGKTANLGQLFPDTTLNTSHSVTIKLLSNQTEYYYKIRADLTTGAQVFSPLANFITPWPLDSTVPTSPSGLTATVISSTKINLIWNASTDNVSVAGYKVYRDGTEIGTSTVTNYNDNSFIAGKNYVYTIKAYDNAGNLSASSAAITVTATLAVAKLSIPSYSVANVTANTVTINWTTNVPSTGVIYYGKTTNFGQYFPDTALKTSHSVTIKWLSNQTKYYYKIRANLPTGAEYYSPLANFTTPR